MLPVSSPDRSPSPGMRQTRLLRLGSVMGVPIFLTPSWLLIAGFIMISDADFLRSQIAGLSSAGAYSLALLFAICLAASVLAHEIGHTVTSRALGLRVNRIVVFLLGGISEIDGEPERPRHELAIAAAGPFVSFVLAAGLWALSLLPAAGSSAAVMLALLAWSNLVIAVFNVLPGLPLDGGRLVQALVWMLGASRPKAGVIAAWSGRFVAIAMALAVLVLNTALAPGNSMSFTSVGATAMGFAVAAFLWFGATQALRMSNLNERAARLSVRQLLRTAVYLPADTPISEAIRRLQAANAGAIAVVDSDGRTRALVEEARISGMEPARRPWSTLAEVARPLESGLVLEDRLSGAELLAAVRSVPASEYLVVGPDGVSRGMIATADVARALGLSQGGTPS